MHNRPIRSLFLAIILTYWGTCSLVRADEPTFLDPTEAFQPALEIVSDQLKVKWHIEDDYFLYRHGFEIYLSQDDVVTDTLFTIGAGKKKYDDFFDKEVEIYHASATTLTDITEYRGQPIQIRLVSQGCADTGLCFPPTSYNFQVNTNGSIGPASESSAFNASDLNPIVTLRDASDTQAEIFTAISTNQLLLTIFSALLGGLILNLMPCVFPVLSLKALSLASGHSSALEQRRHGWAYTAGVLGSFLVAACILLLARGAGETLGWGFQLQHPIFVTLMAYLFFIMGLSLSGVIEFGGGLMGYGQQLATGNTLKSSFFTGVLAALVASPCTAPFMATALGIALTQPAPVSLVIFIALGFGMALPFLALSYSPRLARLLPKPGNWMVVFKQALAFPLYLTVIWLLWVLSRQANDEAVVMSLVGMLLIAISLWMFQFRQKSRSMQLLKNMAALVCLVPVALIAISIDSAENQTQPANHETFTLERLQHYRQQGAPVFVDLTADWCLTCKVNEQIALTDHVKALFQQKNVIFLVGDWTNKNPQVSALLRQHRRSGIPLYLLYPKGKGEPEMLPQLLTEKIVLDALDRALLKSS